MQGNRNPKPMKERRLRELCAKVQRAEAQRGGLSIFCAMQCSIFEFIGYTHHGRMMVRRRLSTHWSDIPIQLHTNNHLYQPTIDLSSDPRTPVTVLRERLGLLTAEQFMEKYDPNQK